MAEDVLGAADKDYAYANDDNDHEDDHEDDHGEDEYELSDEQAAEARGALLADIFALVATYTNVGEGDGGDGGGDGGDQRLTREAFNALGKVLAAAGRRLGRRRRGLVLGDGAPGRGRVRGAARGGRLQRRRRRELRASSSGSSGSSSGHGGGGGLSFERFSAVFAAAPDLGTLETARELLGRAASSKRAFAALKQGHYQLRAAWGATGQLSGIWLGLWASASGGAAQSASMFITGAPRTPGKNENPGE